MLFGIIPIQSIGANGFLLGALYRHAAEGIGYSKAALQVLPHGVFEIPALLIAASYGLWLSVMVIRRMRGKESEHLRSHIGHASRQYLAVIFPLLIVTAAIETALIVMRDKIRWRLQEDSYTARPVFVCSGRRRYDY